MLWINVLYFYVYYLYIHKDFTLNCSRRLNARVRDRKEHFVASMRHVKDNEGSRGGKKSNFSCLTFYSHEKYAFRAICQEIISRTVIQA